MQRNNVIQFPTQPPFAAPRQRGALSNTQLKQKLGSNVPALLPGIYTDIVRSWRSGVQMGYIAKMHQLTKLQVEEAIWATDQGWSPAVAERRAA